MRCLLFIGHALPSHDACFSLAMVYTHVMLVVHWSQLTPTHSLFPVINLLVLSTARCICEQHPPGSSQVKVIYCVRFFFKLIRNHIVNFIGKDINFHPYGFINGRSILSNILESIDISNEYLMEGDNVDVIYLDFRKAFHTVSYYRLLVKMKNLGILKKIVNIVSYFFADRNMNIKIRSNFSKRENILSVFLRDQY